MEAAEVGRSGDDLVEHGTNGHAARDGAAGDDAAEEADAAAAITAVIEDALLRRGWRLEHPAVRGVVLGPTGQRLDANALARRFASRPGPEDVELRALLNLPAEPVRAGPEPTLRHQSAGETPSRASGT